MTLHPDILIYIQNVKNFFNQNNEIKKYYNIDINENLFYIKLIEISINNYKKNNDPKLTVEQFEKLKQNFINEVNKTNLDDEVKQNVLLKSFSELSTIYLN